MVDGPLLGGRSLRECSDPDNVFRFQGAGHDELRADLLRHPIVSTFRSGEHRSVGAPSYLSLWRFHVWLGH